MRIIDMDMTIKNKIGFLSDTTLALLDEAKRLYDAHRALGTDIMLKRLINTKKLTERYFNKESITYVLSSKDDDPYNWYLYSTDKSSVTVVGVRSLWSYYYIGD